MVFSEDEFRKKARKLHRGVAVRNLLEYVVGLFVIAGFARLIWAFPHSLMQASSFLLMVGTPVALWQLHRLTASRPLPQASGGVASRVYAFNCLINSPIGAVYQTGVSEKVRRLTCPVCVE
jgi:hypothetical protein